MSKYQIEINLSSRKRLFQFSTELSLVMLIQTKIDLLFVTHVRTSTDTYGFFFLSNKSADKSWPCFWQQRNTILPIHNLTSSCFSLHSFTHFFPFPTSNCSSLLLASFGSWLASWMVLDGSCLGPFLWSDLWPPRKPASGPTSQPPTSRQLPTLSWVFF